MSDIAIGLASAAGVTIVVTIALLVLSLKLSSAKDDNRDLAVANATLKAQAAVDAKTITDLSNDLKHEQGVSDAIEDVASKPVPVGGALERLLSEAPGMPGAAAGAEGGGGAGAVPASGPAVSDRLSERPGTALERPE